MYETKGDFIPIQWLIEFDWVRGWVGVVDIIQIAMSTIFSNKR